MTVVQTDFSGVGTWRPGLGLRRRARAALHRWWTAVITFPDRGHTATAQDLPPEFYRFPCF